MLHIDIRTAIFALCVGNMMAVALLLVYSHRLKAGRSMRFFMIGKTAQSFGWLLLGLRGAVPLLLSLQAGNGLLMVGFACEAWGVSILRWRPSPWQRKTYAVWALACIVLFETMSFTAPANIRVAMVSLMGFALCSVTGLVLACRKGASSLQRVVGGMYLMLAVSQILRVWAGLQSDSVSLLSSGTVQTVAYATLYMLMLLGSLGYLLLAMEGVVMELRRAATHDDLTGLFNRRAFMDQAGRLLDLAARSGTPVSLCSMDLDHFKQVNDTWGHLMGDRVLRDFAETAQSALRRTDVLARMGGEEFVAMLPNTSREAAVRVATRICRDVGERSPSPGLSYTVSIGVETLDEVQGAGDLERMLQLGDKALYRAKEEGRDRVACSVGAS